MNYGDKQISQDVLKSDKVNKSRKNPLSKEAVLQANRKGKLPVSRANPIPKEPVSRANSTKWEPVSRANPEGQEPRGRGSEPQSDGEDATVGDGTIIMDPRYKLEISKVERRETDLEMESKDVMPAVGEDDEGSNVEIIKHSPSLMLFFQIIMFCYNLYLLK